MRGVRIVTPKTETARAVLDQRVTQEAARLRSSHTDPRDPKTKRPPAKKARR